MDCFIYVCIRSLSYTPRFFLLGEERIDNTERNYNIFYQLFLLSVGMQSSFCSYTYIVFVSEALFVFRFQLGLACMMSFEYQRCHLFVVMNGLA